jgi:hypothetical protein
MSVYYTVVKGSLIMPDRSMARVGDKLKPEQFKGYEKNLQTLLREGNLVQGEGKGQRLDVERGRELPPIPADAIDGPKKGAKGSRALTSTVRDTSKAEAKLKEIQAAQEAKKAAEAARQDALSEHEGEELTLAEAQALGIVGKQ